MSDSLDDVTNWADGGPNETSDRALFAELRAVWEQADPVPDAFAERMVAAVAVADLSREYELLTLVEGAELAQTRTGTAELDSTTLQFSDGVITVLLHVSATGGGARRIDGWVTGDALVVRLMQGEDGWSTEPVDARFAFEDVPAGTASLRLVARGPKPLGGLREFMTAPFAV